MSADEENLTLNITNMKVRRLKLYEKRLSVDGDLFLVYSNGVRALLAVG